MWRNFATTLHQQRIRNLMRACDRAPEPLRRWMADAALP
ncbi:DUF6525 family protein [Rubrimonas cliftonensis]